MNQPIFGAALSLCLLACFAKTTSLGRATDEVDTPDAADAGGGTDGAIRNDAASASDGSTALKNAPCQIGADGHPTVPCPNGELGVGRQFCKSDNATCGSPAHCTDTPPKVPIACLNLECGCDKKLRCNYAAPFDGVDIAPAGFCSLPCGTKTCDATKEFCWHGSGGPGGPDGGATFYECKPVPTECTTDHTCKCLLDHSGSAGPCTDPGGYLDLQVFLP